MENSNDNINTAITTTTNSSIVSVENLNNVANWVSATVISAFFSSLERFSCVNVSTTDPDDDDDDRPLALPTNPHLQHDDVANLPVWSSDRYFLQYRVKKINKSRLDFYCWAFLLLGFHENVKLWYCDQLINYYCVRWLSDLFFFVNWKYFVDLCFIIAKCW